MHAEGLFNGGRFGWAKHYENPELDAMIDSANSQPLTIDELDP